MSLRVPLPFSLAPVVLLALVFPACGGGGGGGGGTTKATLTVTALTPSKDMNALPGALVPIRYRDDDKVPPENVTTSLYAVPVDTPDSPILFAANRPAGADSVQYVNWDTKGVPAGTYRIEARSTDGKYQASSYTPGTVTISSAPITFLSPTSDSTISRGGFARMDYTANYPMEQALLSFFADLDGDPTTTSDEFPITSNVADANGALQAAIWDTTGVATGIYHIFGTVEEPGKDPVTILMPPRFYLSDISTCGEAGTATADLAYDVGSFPDGSSVAVGVWNTDPNGAHGFFAKFKSGGQLQIANGMETDTSSDFKQVLTWSDGTWFVYGDLTSNGILGRREPNQTTLNAGRFWAMFHADGTLAWARPTPFPAGASEKCFDALPGGGFLVAGTYSGSVTFATGGAVGTYTSQGGTDVFVARCDSNGTPKWLAFVGGAGNDVPFRVRGLPDGSVLLLGSFTGSATVGIGAPGAVSLTSKGATGSFIARLQPNGYALWATPDQVPLTGTPPGANLDLGAFPDGSFVITGTLSQSASFAVGTSMEQTLSVTGPNMFLARFSSAGTFVNVKSATDGSGSVTPTDLATFGDGSVVVVGDVGQGTLFGPGERPGKVLPAGGFRAGWSGSNSLVFVESQPRGTAPLSVAGFADGSFVVAGDFTGSVTFGAGTSKQKTLSVPTGASYDSDVYIVKYNGDGEY